MSGIVVFQNNFFTYLDRIRGNDGNYLSQAALSAIDYTIWDITDRANESQVGESPTTLTIADVVFNSLQTGDPRWTKDSDGFNFAFDVLANVLDGPSKLYLFEVKFTPTAGADYASYVSFEVQTRNLRRT